MSFIAWIVVGIVAGALAKILMPGDDSNNIITTMILGIIGAFVGGFLGKAFGVDVTGINLLSILVATAGAFLVLFIWKKVRGR